MAHQLEVGLSLLRELVPDLAWRGRLAHRIERLALRPGGLGRDDEPLVAVHVDAERDDIATRAMPRFVNDAEAALSEFIENLVVTNLTDRW